MIEPPKKLKAMNLNRCLNCGEEARFYPAPDAWKVHCTNKSCTLHFVLFLPEKWQMLMTPPQLIAVPETEHEAKEFIRIGRERLAEIKNEEQIIQKLVADEFIRYTSN